MLILAFSCNNKNCLVLSATLSVTSLYSVPLGLRFPLIVCTSVLTSPQDTPTHWHQMIFFLNEPIQVQTGGSGLTLIY